MKKTLFFASIFVSLVLFASCDKEEIITESELPLTSRNFIATHFSGIAISHIVKDTEGFGIDYTVYLANGFEIDFVKSGDWDDVDGHIQPLPQSILDLLPAGIPAYVASHFNNYQPVEVNKENYGYEIGLTHDIDLRFNSGGNFIGYDD